jgi:ribonuclease HI
MDKLNFLQNNIHSLNKNKDTLKGFLNIYKTHIALLSETFSMEKNQIKISGYDYINVSRSDNYGGAGILIRKNLAYSIIDTPREHDIQMCIIKIHKLNLHVISLYITPSASEVVVNNYLRAELEVLKKEKIIIGGDFNAHDLLWGGRSTNKFGEIVLEIIRDFHLSLLNDGSDTYINKRGENSAIDLTFTTKNIHNKIKDWKVQKDSVNGEHLIITFTLSKQNTKGTIKTKTIQNKNKICQELQRLECPPSLGLEASLEKISSIVAQNTKVIISESQPKLWWNDEIQTIFNEYREALRECNKHPFDSHVKKFNAVKKKWDRARFDAKKKSADDTISQITCNITGKEMWNIANGIDGKKTNRAQCNFVLECNTQSKKFMEKIFPDSHDNPLVDIELPGNIIDDVTPSSDDATPLIDEKSFEKILKNKKDTSCPGTDGISYLFLKNITNSMKTNIIDELNKIYNEEKVPDFLKEAKLLPILKPQKDKCSVDSYRPIMLQKTALKILGSAVLKEIDDFNIKNKIIPPTSFGFQQNKSTIACTNYMRTWTCNKRAEGKNVIWIFLDMSAAFDGVKIDMLVKIMNDFHFPKKIVSYIHSAFTQRKVTLVNNEGKKFSKLVNNGLPQGAPESPTGFNIYTANLHKLCTENFQLAQVADDFTLMFAAKSNKLLQQLVNGKLRNFVKALKELNFKINPSKTSALLFKHNNDEYEPKVEIDSHAIKMSTHAKVLGTTFDPYFKFKAHHESMQQKIDERSNVIKRLAGTKFGGHPSQLLTIYKATIRSVIEYDAAIYGDSLKRHDTALQKKQDFMLRLIVGLPKTAPSNIVAALSCEAPIIIRRQHVIQRQTLRECVTQSPSNSIWAKEWKKMQHKYEFNRNVINPTYNCYINQHDFFSSIEIICYNKYKNATFNIHIELHHIIGKKENASNTTMRTLAQEFINKLPHNCIKIFTDASKIDDLCGYGFYCEMNNHQESIKLNNYASICTAELLAIKHALNYAKENSMKKAVILTDSLSSCKLINSQAQQSYVSESIIEILELLVHTQSSIAWIPSHVGIEGNEIADELARVGAESEKVLNNKIRLVDAKALTENESTENFQKFIIESEKGEKFRNFFKLTQKPWFHKCKMNGVDIKLINRLISNHSYDRRWLFRFGKVDSELCETCNVAETAEHLVFKCQKYTTSRQKFKHLASTTSIEAFWQSTNRDIMLNEITRFIKTNKIEF